MSRLELCNCVRPLHCGQTIPWSALRNRLLKNQQGGLAYRNYHSLWCLVVVYLLEDTDKSFVSTKTTSSGYGERYRHIVLISVEYMHEMLKMARITLLAFGHTNALSGVIRPHLWAMLVCLILLRPFQNIRRYGMR